MGEKYFSLLLPLYLLTLPHSSPLQTLVMKIPVATTILETWKNNLQPDSNTPVLTTDALITLTELEDFVTHIKGQRADSIRISLVRFDRNNNEPQSKKEKDNNFPIGCKWRIAGDKTQVAIAINGTKGFTQKEDYTTKATDIIEGTSVFMLIPGGEIEGPTGHNPPTSTKPGGK